MTESIEATAKRVLELDDGGGPTWWDNDLPLAALPREYRTLAPQLARYVLAARAVVENAEALLRVDGNRGPDGRVATWDAGAFVRSRDALLAALARVAALSSPAQPTETTT